MLIDFKNHLLGEHGACLAPYLMPKRRVASSAKFIKSFTPLIILWRGENSEAVGQLRIHITGMSSKIVSNIMGPSVEEVSATLLVK